MEPLPRQGWLEAEPRRASTEREEMAKVAPDLDWIGDNDAGGWEGLVPVWPFDRPLPQELDEFLAGRRLRVRVEYPQSFPMVEPSIFPLDPEPEVYQRTQARWHVLGDGSLCLLQTASDWTGRGTAADLIVKAAGWFLEFILMQMGEIDEMTTDGIVNDPGLDHLFDAAHANPSKRNEDQPGA